MLKNIQKQNIQISVHLILNANLSDNWKCGLRKSRKTEVTGNEENDFFIMGSLVENPHTNYRK